MSSPLYEYLAELVDHDMQGAGSWVDLYKPTAPISEALIKVQNHNVTNAEIAYLIGALAAATIDLHNEHIGPSAGRRLMTLRQSWPT